MYLFSSRLRHFVFHWCHARQSLKVFAEKRGVGKVHLVADLRHLLVGMPQFHLDASDDGFVYPFLGSPAADFFDDGAHVAGGEEEVLGIEVDIVLLGRMLVDKLDEVVKQALFA